MAKNIMVNEGSSLKIVKNVSKLATILQDNSELLWVPEDEIKLVPKTIIQDGTYVANREIGNPYGYSEVIVSGVGDLIIGDTARKTFSQNGVYYANEDLSGPFYGYSEVTVNVDSYSGGSGGSGGGQPTSGTVGKDTDGDDAMVVVNPDTGKLEVEKIPVRIEVITPPYNPYVTYNHGQTIEKTGMVVMAYTGDDEEWGEVPLDEITIDPTVADYNEREGGIMNVSAAGTRLVAYQSTGWPVDRIWEKAYDGEAYFTFLYLPGERYENVPVLISSVNDDRAAVHWWEPYGTLDGISYPIGGVDVNGTLYYCTHPADVDGELIYSTVPPIYGYNTLEEAVRGIMTSDPGNFIEPGQRIIVTWSRPGDHKVLETIFVINVAPPIAGTND